MTGRNRLVIGSLIFVVFASSALAIAFNSQPEDSWAQHDDFIKALPAKLQSSQGNQSEFNIVALARQLSEIRVDGMPVCTVEEVSAEQYIELSAVAEKVSVYPGINLQLNDMLDSNAGLSDCQFRILEAVAGS